jgi:hypothetical protein
MIGVLSFALAIGKELKLLQSTVGHPSSHVVCLCFIPREHSMI